MVNQKVMITLPKELLEKSKQMANVSGRTFSGFVRIALEEHIRITLEEHDHAY